MLNLLVVCLFLTLESAVAVSPDGRIFGGNEVTPHQYPYVARLSTTIDYREVICGGTLVDKNAILTAASCVYGAKSVDILLGAHNISDPDASQIQLSSSEFIIHENYSSETKEHNIAIIKLKSNVEINENIALVNLVGLLDLSKTYADELGLVIGWGKLNDTEPEPSDVLMEFEATIISTLTCNLSYLFKLQDYQMCTTGVFKKNICLGDTGSPLISDNKQVGIASYGSDFGCTIGLPGVYTRLTKYIGWVNIHLD